jgi:chromate transporter
VAALLLALGPDNVFSRIALFFSQMAVVTFGGAYSVLAYVAQQAVETYGWLSPEEMLDGLGMAETTPGPLIMVVQFVGFLGAYRDAGALAPLAGGDAGVGADHLGHLRAVLPVDFPGRAVRGDARGNRAVSGALSAITAAVVGVVLNLAVWFALHLLFGTLTPIEGWGLQSEAPVLASVRWPALLLTTAALIAVFRFKVGLITVLLASAAAGVAMRLAGLGLS